MPELVGEGVSTKSLAIVTSANDNYVPNAVMALNSFRRWHPEFGYFLLGNRVKMSLKSLELMRQFGIEFIHVDEGEPFIRTGPCKDNYPIEVLYILYCPELFSNLNFEYSLYVDGDVFCSQPVDFSAILPNVDGVAARPVRTLESLRADYFSRGWEPFDFSRSSVLQAFGLDRKTLMTALEVNTGVVFWNNNKMQEIDFLEKARTIFEQGQGSFEGDQDLISYTAASQSIPIFELFDGHNFAFFADSMRYDVRLRNQVGTGDFTNVFIVHFVYGKPWLEANDVGPVKGHFVNAWRQYVCQALGAEAKDYFPCVETLKQTETIQQDRYRLVLYAFGMVAALKPVLWFVRRALPGVVRDRIRKMLWQ